MCFGYQVFDTVEKFSSDIQIIDSERNQIYTLANLDKATPEELQTLKNFESAHVRCESRHAFTNYEELEKY